MENARVSAKIPAGIHHQATIRLSGKGEAGHQGGDFGDLYIHIKVASSKEFERINLDIHTTQKIHLLQAVLGDEIQVRTIDGFVDLKIPAGTQAGRIFKIKGHGVPKIGALTRGDHYLKIEVTIPEKLSRKEKELYHELLEASGLRIQPEDKGLFG